MRNCICIICFIIGFTFIGFGQREIESKRLVFHAPFKEFFRQHPNIKEIRFNVDKASGIVNLSILKDSLDYIQRGDVFDLNAKGDRYSFQKKYGTFHFPSYIYDGFIDPRASSTNIDGKVRQDSVFMSISQWYESNNLKTDDEDKIFIKVESTAGYEKGDKNFQKEMENYFQHTKAIDFPPDSVVIVYAIIHPNKSIVVDTVLQGNSGFAQSIVEFINKSGPWRPMEACGRKVKAYKKIYAKLNSDNSFETELY